MTIPPAYTKRPDLWGEFSERLVTNESNHMTSVSEINQAAPTRRPFTLPDGLLEAEAARMSDDRGEIVSFSGGDSFGLIANVAADLEAQGRVPRLEWRRDLQGIIIGLAIVEDVGRCA